MKRYYLLFFIIIFCSSLGQSHGFVNNRYQWWKIQLQRLDNSRNLLLKNSKIDNKVTALIDVEIERAKSIISIFEKNIRNDGSLNNVSRKFEIDEIKNEVKKSFCPIFSVLYLEIFINDIGNRDNLYFTKDAVKDYLNGLTSKRFNQDGTELVNIIMNEEINQNDWKNLSMELFAGRLIMNKKELMDNSLAHISSSVVNKLELENFVTNRKKLNDIIVNSISDYMLKYNVTDNLKHSKKALEMSWCWKKVLFKQDRNFANYEKIISMLNKPGPVSFEKIRYYYNNPGDLNTVAFSDINSRYFKMVTYKNSHASAAHENAMAIPENPDIKSAIYEMDSLRKNSISLIPEKIDNDFFNNIHSGYDRIILKYTDPVKNKFFREEEKIRLLKAEEDEGSGHTGNLIINEIEFQKAKGIFYLQLKRLNEYKEKSIKFLKWLSDSYLLDGEQFVKNYKYQVTRNKIYLIFLKDLVSDCRTVSSINSNFYHKKFAKSIRRISNIFKFIGYSLSIEREYLSLLKGRQIRITKDIKLNFTKKMKSIKSDISRYYRDYSRTRAEIARRNKSTAESLKDKIAQYEIDILSDNTKDCAELYNRYRYAETALANYLIKYISFKEEIEDGTVSHSLEYLLKMMSLIPGIQEFDKSRITEECNIKKYLKGKAMIAVSRLLTVKKYYKKRKVEVGDYPTNEDVRKIKKLLDRKAEIKIASWRMDDINFEKIDRNVVAELSAILKRRIWNSQSGKTKENDNKENFKIKVDELNLSIYIPNGWQEEHLMDNDKQEGVLKLFNSVDSDSSIKLIKIPAHEGNIKEITEAWVKKSGCEMVKKQWGKKDKLEYFWILSRDSDKNIMESYTIIKDDYAIIISGKTKRSKYGYFRGKLNAVFRSLKF